MRRSRVHFLPLTQVGRLTSLRSELRAEAFHYLAAVLVGRIEPPGPAIGAPPWTAQFHYSYSPVRNPQVQGIHAPLISGVETT
jgi:hypothetical protein